MCGIFGIFNKNRVDRHQFCQLGEINKQRGNLAFGYFVGKVYEKNSQVDVRVFRYLQPFDASLVLQEEVQFSLGHIRAPTGGQSKNLADIHPFETHDGYLAHNGLLLNHTQFSAWHIMNSHINVDSQVIIGGIQHFLNQGIEVSQAIKNTIETLEGQQACWYWHKPEQCLYLWRIMSPIYVNQDVGIFCFSSTKHELADTLLKEGIIYQYNLRLFTLTEITNFSFHSPYQV